MPRREATMTKTYTVLTAELEKAFEEAKSTFNSGQGLFEDGESRLQTQCDRLDKIIRTSFARQDVVTKPSSRAKETDETRQTWRSRKAAALRFLLETFPAKDQYPLPYQSLADESADRENQENQWVAEVKKAAEDASRANAEREFFLALHQQPRSVKMSVKS